MPPETSSLRAVFQSGRLSRAHIERFASELAKYHARIETPIGYLSERGRILHNVFLHHGEMTLRPPAAHGRDRQGGEPVGDVAGVVLELESLGQSQLANFFLAAWLEQSGAFHALATLRSYLAGENRGALMLTHGPSGAGKTTLATALAGSIGAVVVRNDAEIVRLKQRHRALAPGMLIDRLEMLAIQVIRAGWPVIVESCFLNRANRRRFRARAAELAVPFAILDCAAPIATLRERLERRRAFGSLFHGDDAGAERVERELRAQLDRQDALDDEEKAITVTVDSSQPVDHERLAARMKLLCQA